jgi:hypothetical protein
MFGFGYTGIIASMKKLPSGGGNGALTTAWIAATSETDTTIISALNTLETDLTTYGLTAKIKALYPMVGSTAAKHKFNFMDARDLDAAFRLTFSGGWTHSANGINGNLINTFADTFFIPSAQLTLSSGHYSIYSRTNLNETSIDLGVLSGSVHQIITRLANEQTYSYASTNIGVAVANTDSRGLYITNRNSSTNTTGYKNGTKVADVAMTAGLPIDTVFIGARNQGGSAIIPSSRQYSFASIGSGLTDTEAANLYTAVQAFQTTLSRQV